MSAVAKELRRTSSIGDWIAFAFQVFIAVSVEVGDDIGRGFVSQHGTIEGVRNARRIIAFEAAHGVWVEPAWQSFFLHAHSILSIRITWREIADLMNVVYVFGHIGITLSVAIWIYVNRRRYFAFLRNTIIVTNVLALFVYENFPVAPPRLVGSVSFDGHPFAFYDTMYGLVSSGSRAVGTHTGYNEFSAMPSVHMAWALVAGLAVVFLAKHWPVKILGALYPVLMLIAIVVTGNHFVLDAVAAAGVVAAAGGIAYAIERGKRKVSMPCRRGPGPALHAPTS